MSRIRVNEYPVNLDIGCGKQCEEGYETGIDIQDFGQDIVWDVRNGIPLPDKSVQKIHSAHFFEHLTYAELQPLMQEIRRVLREGCPLQIYVPHMETCDGAYDYAHRSFWNEQRARGFFTRLDYEIISMERISNGMTLKVMMKILPVS